MKKSIAKAYISLMLGSCVAYFYTCSDLIPALLYWLGIAFYLTLYPEIMVSLWTKQSAIRRCSVTNKYVALLCLLFVIPLIIVVILSI